VAFLKCAKLVAPRKIVIEEAPKPTPGPHEVIIEVRYCGICGSDIHAYHGRHPFIHPPIVLGHEFSGVVHEVGESVEYVFRGQRAVVEPLLTCGRCLNCRLGDYNRCKELKVIGCQTDGAFAEFVKVPAHRVFEIPDDLDFLTAAFTEPVAVAVHAVKRAGPLAGNKVLVLGSGTIGLLVAAVSKIYGAAEVISTDIYDYKLDVALRMGADQVVNVRRESLEEYIFKHVDPEGVDVVFECVGGVKETLEQAVKVTRRGARVVVVGVFGKPVEVNVGLVQDKELEVKGSAVYIFKDFLDAIELLRRRRIDVRPLATKVFSLDQVPDAFKYIDEHRDTAIKVLIKVKD